MFSEAVSYAPWCPACKSLSPVWKDFATWADDLGIKVADVDVVANPVHVVQVMIFMQFDFALTNMPEPRMSGRFMITALPTIFHVKDGVFRQYRGSRDKNGFISFVEEKKWKSVEQVPGWQAPQSLQMNVVSSVFKFSMIIRNLHNQMVEDLGLPVWASYLVFAAATVLVGSLMGLLLVVIIDLLFPARPAPHPPVLPKEEQHPPPQEATKEEVLPSPKEEEEGEEAGQNMRKRAVATEESTSTPAES
ncbi:TMX1 [Cordylochernes scorpioides]|uniref:TMX1 n=1 Tax=Cordylochernes scorpioides TaxID=51811 RepID=A0ABY6L4J4_9ARAC|nr:TMX1 [Cordylochernes scorpioides]